MNPRRDPDRLIHAFLSEGATELADEVYDTVRDRIEVTRQRAVFGPWREPDVNRTLKIALSAAAVLVIAVVGYRQFGSVNEVGPAASVSPAPTVAASSPSAAASGQFLTETFSSDRYGLTMSYPSGWVARASTDPWTTSVPDYLSNTGDVVYDPSSGEGGLWISVASQPLGDATPEAWAAETIALDDGCTATEPITIDGASGLIGTEECSRAAVTKDGRGYFFWLYTGGDDPSLAATYDQAWFKDVLATVQLQPDAAALTDTFQDGTHGILFSHPGSWVERQATEVWTTSVPDYLSNAADVVHDPTRGEGNLWISVASQPLGDATPEAWAAETIALDDGCTATEPITVDGASGLVGADGCTRAAVTKDGQGYFFWLYTSGDDPSLAATYDQAWFKDVLATVQLQP